jgi:hypothetical protein
VTQKASAQPARLIIIATTVTQSSILFCHMSHSVVPASATAALNSPTYWTNFGDGASALSLSHASKRYRSIYWKSIPKHKMTNDSRLIASVVCNRLSTLLSYRLFSTIKAKCALQITLTSSPLCLNMFKTAAGGSYRI